MKRFLSAAVLGLAAVVMQAQSAEATLLVAVDVNGTQFCASDNNVGCTFGAILLDTDPTVGIIDVGDQTIAGVNIQGSAQTATYGPPLNILNTSSLQFQNTTAGNLDIVFAVGATDFTPPVTEAFASTSLTWQLANGSTVTQRWYNDPNNEQGAETASDTPGDLLATFTDTAVGIVDSGNFNGGPFAVSDPLPFSMTILTEFTLTPGAVVVGNSATVIKPVAVPEPASMALFGLGLVGVGMAARRRRALK